MGLTAREVNLLDRFSELPDPRMASGSEMVAAIERDRIMGYPERELHKPPERVLKEALEALESVGESTDELMRGYEWRGDRLYRDKGGD